MSLEESGVPTTIVDMAPMDWLRRQAPEAEYLLTSRLDNDDEYLPQFVAAVQAAFSPTTQVLDVQGVQSDGLGYFTIHREEPNSPFISLVEPWHDVKTAHFENHTRMAQISPARCFRRMKRAGCLLSLRRSEPQVLPQLHVKPSVDCFGGDAAAWR